MDSPSDEVDEVECGSVTLAPFQGSGNRSARAA